MPRVEWTLLSGDQAEELVAMMLLRERAYGARMRPSRGDGGIDVITPQRGRHPIVDQIKRFTGPSLTSGQKQQIVDSLTAVRETLSDELSEWNLVLPMDHTPEQKLWFDSLETPFRKNWVGLTNVDGLAARYPDVVDYLLHGGRERIRDQYTSLMDLLSLDRAAEREPDLTVGMIMPTLASAVTAINRSDPMYSYEIRIGQSPHPPISGPGHVCSFSAGYPDGAHVAVDVFARFAQAVDLRPIPITLTLKPDSTSAVEAVERWIEYGQALEVDAEIEFPGELPGGLPIPSGEARVRLFQHPPPDRPDIELRAIDVDDETIAALPVRITSSNHGRSGIQFCGQDDSGAIAIECTTDNESQSAQFNVSVELEQLAGKPVLLCRDVLNLVTKVVPPNRLAIAIQHGGTLARSELLDEIVGDPNHLALLELLDALSVIQARCAVPLLFDEAEVERDQAEIRDCAALLRGETIVESWSDLTITIGGHETPTELTGPPKALVIDVDIAFEIFGVRIELGTQRTVCESAQLADRSTLENDRATELRLVPGATTVSRRWLLNRDDVAG